MQQIVRKVTGRKARKAMTVATAFTGITAAALAFAPQEAKASPAPSKMPFGIAVYTPPSVYYEQACGYQSPAPGTWWCTPIEAYSGAGVGTGYYGLGVNWRRGKTNIWEWSKNRNKEVGHTCNTNGSYYGWFYPASRELYLYGPGSKPLGLTNTAEC